jgi:Zn-dependent peptidase ImmA (M78 family)
MSPLILTYPHWRTSGKPEHLAASQVWAVARAARRHLAPDGLARRLELDALISGTQALTVNEVAFGVVWDLDHDVRNEADKPVMGITEYDPGEPASVMVSINGHALSGRDDLLRSTAAHELGHVVFDAPGWIRNAKFRQNAGLSQIAERECSVAHSSEDSAFHRREFRANEFMGALLAPAALLRVDLQRFAKRQRWPASARSSQIVRGAPAYDGRALEADAVTDLLFALSDQYGLSESFIRVRLDRYDLLRTGNHTQQFRL